MPTRPYSLHLTDADHGITIAHDVEFMLDVRIDVEWSETVVTVLAVYSADDHLPGSDLLTSSDTLAKAIGLRVKATAEDDPDLREALEEDDERLVYEGQGGNDPSGRWRVRGEAA